MWHGRLFTVIGGSLLILSVAASTGAAAPAMGQWRVLVKVPKIVDVAGPRADGKLVLSTQAGLFLLRPGGAPEPFANGPGGYTASVNEPYIALAYGSRVYGVRGCSFEAGDVFALDASPDPGHRPRASERSGISLPRPSRPARSHPGSHSTASAGSATGYS